MFATLRLSVLVLTCGVVGASGASAAPVTWQSAGTIDYVTDQNASLPGIVTGALWTLAVTFEPETPGELQNILGNIPTYRYANAIQQTTFELAGFSYVNAGGDIYTNADLPYVGASTALGGPGLVQLQWRGGWTGGAGGPNLNAGLGLFLASYNDVNALDGSLPVVPVRSPEQGNLSGLMWNLTLPPGIAQFGSAQFNPQVDPLTSMVPIPEPASMLLVGTGVALLARYRRGDRRAARHASSSLQSDGQTSID